MRQTLFFAVFVLAIAGTSVVQGRKCYDNSLCNACTTCSGRKHCNEGGGTCGVGSTGKHYNGGSYSNCGSESILEYKPKVIPISQKAAGDIYKVTASSLTQRTGFGTTYGYNSI